ncbi:hypothetical protein GGR54DRAFT_653521 [Hypoxylon sp. NC1633]|nr:hypothetical protein GGR54DRAFT_653521 [Hypoxylon sp. NC1633]
MAYEEFVAYMKLRYVDGGDSFPERHFPPDFLSITLDNKDGDSDGDGDGENSHQIQCTLKPKCSRQPPKSPSESPKGYEMRNRYYWEAADVMECDCEKSKKAPDVWDYVYDPVFLPPSKTPAMRRLGNMLIRRAWKRWSTTEKPNMRQARVFQAIMTYERGIILNAEGRFSRCREGKGVSPEYAIKPDVEGKVCSNCQYDAVRDQCNERSQPLGSRGDGAKCRSDETGNERMAPSKEDYMTVLKLIEQMKKTSRAELEKGDHVSIRAKQIEEAALKVTRASREWGGRENSARP